MAPHTNHNVNSSTLVAILLSALMLTSLYGVSKRGHNTPIYTGRKRPESSTYMLIDNPFVKSVCGKLDEEGKQRDDKKKKKENKVDESKRRALTSFTMPRKLTNMEVKL